MLDHPGDLELEGFLAGGLPPAARNAVLLHLSRACPRCRRRLARLAERTLGSGRTAEPAAGSTPDNADYDNALERAFAVARSREQALAGERREADRDFAVLLGGRATEASLAAGSRGGWALTERLLAESRALRYRDPAGMVRLAEVARLAVSQVSPDRYGAAPVADLETRVLAELANAYRVADDLEEAERLMVLAEERQREGTGDLLVKALLLSLTATLRKDQDRPVEGVALLRRVHGLYMEIGERHLAGRALVSRGTCLLDTGDWRSSLRLLTAGVAAIDPDRDPNLVVMAEQNMAWALVFGGRFEAARERLRTSDFRSVRNAELLLARIEWLEGRIALGFGDRRRAATAFRNAREVFLAAGQPSNAALVAQDLAAALTGSAPSGPTAG